MSRCHILRRNCLLVQQVIEGKIKEEIEVTGRRVRRRRKLLDDLKERRGYSHSKEEALDRTMWRARFGRGFGPVVRQATEWMTCLGLCVHLNSYTAASRGHSWIFMPSSLHVMRYVINFGRKHSHDCWSETYNIFTYTAWKRDYVTTG
jgi:hypothetical protein